MGATIEYFSAASATFSLRLATPEPQRETYGPCIGFDSHPEHGCNRAVTAQACEPCAAFETARGVHGAASEAQRADRGEAWVNTTPEPQREQFGECTNVAQFPDTCPYWTDCDPCETFAADHERWERRDLSGLNSPTLSLSDDSVARIVGDLPALHALLTGALAKVEAAMPPA